MCLRILGLCVITFLAWNSAMGDVVVNNMQLQNYVLRRLKHSSYYDCLAQCLADPQCRSFNFLVPTLVCELNVRTKTEKPNSFVSKKGSMYVNKDDVSPATNPLKSPCATHHCADCEVCRVERGTSQTTCMPRDDYVTVSSECLQSSVETPNKTRDCYDVAVTNKSVGVHVLSAQEVDGFSVYCDLLCGGWLVFQRRMDGSEDFYRTWNEYKDGFGNLTGEFWLGNEKIHQITKQRRYELRIDLEDFEGQRRYAKYSSFSLDSRENNYTLHIGAYSGDAGAGCSPPLKRSVVGSILLSGPNCSLGYFPFQPVLYNWFNKGRGDSLFPHNNRQFSAKDVDVDVHRDNCAELFHGAWWYSGCHLSNLNGHYLGGRTDEYATGVVWRTWRDYYYSLKSVEMKFRPTTSGELGNSLSYHDNRPFGAKDTSSCAVSYHGAWWYNACHRTNLNGKYLGGTTTEYAIGVTWRTWKGQHYSLKRTQMMLRPTV